MKNNMKYLKTFMNKDLEFITEKREIKPYIKYIPELSELLKVVFGNLFDYNRIEIFKNDNGTMEIILKTRYNQSLTKKKFESISLILDNPLINYKIEPANANQMWLHLTNLSSSLFDKLDLRIDAKKYNL